MTSLQATALPSSPLLVDDDEATRCRQRYFVCDKRNWKENGPIFFYVGNEADVTL